MTRLFPGFLKFQRHENDAWADSKCHMKKKQDFAHVIMKHVPELIVDRRRVYETTERRIRGDVYMVNKSYFRDGTLLFRKGKSPGRLILSMII